MQHFGVWDNEVISQKIAAGLNACGIPFVQMRTFGQWQAKNSLLVFGPRVRFPFWGKRLRVRYLLFPDGMHPCVEADCAVSYGLSGRDSITISSLQENRMVLSLQRELVTVSGVILDRQELLLPYLTALSVVETLAVYGALLLLGVAPSQLFHCCT